VLKRLIGQALRPERHTGAEEERVQIRKVQSTAWGLVSGAGVAIILARCCGGAGTEMGAAVFTGTTAACDGLTGIELVVTGAGLFDDILQQEPPSGAAVTCGVAADCCAIMGQSGGQCILESSVSADVQQAALIAIAGSARAATISIRATNLEMPLILVCVS
jgi:hypothetical protein